MTYNDFQASIFSAIVTTFVVESCHDLKVDYAEVSANILHDLLSLQFSLAQGVAPSDLSAPSITSPSPFRAKPADLWINGLWFSSLALSLSTALITVLTKQWIHQCMAVSSGTTRDRARIRQFRYTSFLKWHVPLMIGLLPVFIHASLGAFFVGLVIHLYSLNGIIAAGLSAVAGTTFMSTLR